LASNERVCYLFVRRDAESADVLVLRFPDGQTALPVFGLEEEAGMFLWLETAGEGWRVAELSEADLVALLRGSCASVRRIARPFAGAGDAGSAPATVDREVFLRALLEERSRRGAGAGSSHLPRGFAMEGEDSW
jgi:predicted RNA-binding Zn ribbon-like protein